MPKTPTSRNAHSTKWLLIAAIGFAGLIIASFVSETLLPLYKSGETTELLLNALGFPIILIGTALFVHGGYIFVKSTFQAWLTPELIQNTKLVRSKTTGWKAAAKHNRGILFDAWKPGLIRMIFGFTLIAAGSVVINALKIAGQQQMM